MNPVSRPLRALGLTLVGWTTIRVVALWPVSGGAVPAPVIDPALAEPPRAVVTMPLDDNVPLFARRPLSPRILVALRLAHQGALVRQEEVILGATPTPDQPRQIATASRAEPPIPTPNAIAPGLPAPASHDRFSGSAWALMRSDGASSLASGGQLGGSQIGMRVFYTPGPEALAITARVSAALSRSTGREAAIGIALRGRNVGIIAEQRFSLDRGGRNAPAVFAYGGASDIMLPGGVRLDGYAQAGVVGVKNPAAFVDGAIRVERTILRGDKSSLAAGSGAWGGAQPAASRLDVGPQIVAHVAAAGTNLRVSAEWRQRVAGNATPASGPSVTVGFDF